MRGLTLLLFALTACSERPAAPEGRSDLEAAAIARGLVRDPSAGAIDGIYARAGDRMCVASAGERVRIGGFVDFGDGIGCAAAGTATRDGDRIAIDWGAGCRFDATFDGDRIAVPGALPDACRRLCTRGASFAGFAADRLGDSTREATALRSPSGRALCR